MVVAKKRSAQTVQRTRLIPSPPFLIDSPRWPGSHLEQTDEGGQRTNINDAAIAALEHVPAEDLAGAQCAGQIGFDDGIPLLFAQIESWRALRDSGAVDEDVHAPECRDDLSQGL